MAAFHQESVTVTVNLPVDGMSWLAAGVIADLDVTLVELHCNMIVVSIVQQDTVILSC